TEGSLPVDQSLSSAVNLQSWNYYELTGASLGTTVALNLSQLSADADLYVRSGSQPTLQEFDCRSFAGGTQSELCTVTQGNAPIWIGVYGFAASNFNLSATSQSASAVIATGTQQTASIGLGEWQYYRVQNTAGIAAANVTLSNLSADIDLYTSANGFPSLSDFDCRSYRSGTANEDCVENLTNDTIIAVYGYRAGTYTLAVGATLATRSKLETKIEKGIDVKAADASLVSPAGSVTTGGGGGSADWALLLLPVLSVLRRRRI
ncbi:MAG: PPC domain-containing protein, partial [Pseudomonadota bacterium]